MPISALQNASSRPRAGEVGLTLVEVLVVLAVIAVASAAAMLSAGAGGTGRSVDAEARRLAISLQRVSDDALVAARPATLVWDGGGYSFAGAEGSVAGDPRMLPEGMSLVSTAQSPIEIAGEGLSSPFELTLSSGGDARTVRYDGLNAELLVGRP